jgi:sucrose-6F-phosphate phosphohydrolase
MQSMTRQLLICTDLDRTLIPNGPQSESKGARKIFSRLVARPDVMLVYVSGRHRELVQQAIHNFSLPLPDYVIGDVGTTIYHVQGADNWQHIQQWEQDIGHDWNGLMQADLKQLLHSVKGLRLQPASCQNAYKLSYFVPLQADRRKLADNINARLVGAGVNARLVWSVDEPAGVGLLDILPDSASKYHAIMALIRGLHLDESQCVFCGDSGNDIEVLVSPLPAVLVANAQPQVRQQAIELAGQNGKLEQLYIARGDFMGMNGNYAAGMLEGIAYYFPEVGDWLADHGEIQ